MEMSGMQCNQINYSWTTIIDIECVVYIAVVVWVGNGVEYTVDKIEITNLLDVEQTSLLNLLNTDETLWDRDDTGLQLSSMHAWDSGNKH